MIRQYSIDHNIFISDIKFLAALIFFFLPLLLMFCEQKYVSYE